MIKYLLIIFVFSNSFASTESIFNKLKFANNLSNAKLFYEECEVGAYAYRGNVTVCYSTLKDIRNDDEMARLLGHELGHIARGDLRSSITSEYASDALAAKYMRKAGYNVCRGAEFIKRRNMPQSDYHPSDYDRWLRFNCK